MANADFCILPKGAVDYADPKAPIINHTDTSGAYFLRENASSGQRQFIANTNSHLYSPQMPQVISVVDCTGLKYDTCTKDLKIDFFNPVSPISKELEKFLLIERGFSGFHSIPMNLWFVAFSPSALHDFTPSQRALLGSQISQSYLSQFPTPHPTPTNAFFQPDSAGSLTLEQNEFLNKLRATPPNTTFARKATLPIGSMYFAQATEALASAENISVTRIAGNIHHYRLDPKDRGDISIVSTDTAWDEDLPLLAYNISRGRFHLSGLDGSQWLSEYISKETREERLQLMRDLHFKLLSQVVIYPIHINPYSFYIAKGWLLNLSKAAHTADFWRIRKAQ